MRLLFWVCVAGATYSYIFYPIILLALPKRKKIQTRDLDISPKVSIIVTAHNEQLRIRDKLINTLEIDYPIEKREILVASDASSDTTDDIVHDFEDRGVRLVRTTERKGKENAQALAIGETEGEILIFSDVATRIAPGSVRKLVRNFSNPRVGAVSSEDRFTSREGRVVGEGAYVKYEMWLRRLESNVNSVVGLSGSFFAARRKVCSHWDVHVPSDFNTAMCCIRQGYVAVWDSDVVGFYADVTDEKREYRRKVRTVIRGLAAIFRRPDVLNPFAFGLFAFQVWSHKILRWLVPWFLISLLITSAVLSNSHCFYAAIFTVQCIFYLIAVIGILSKNVRTAAAIRMPFFFIQANVAIAHATVAFLLGKRITTWEPSKR